jgi:hypothetical protein
MKIRANDLDAEVDTSCPRTDAQGRLLFVVLLIMGLGLGLACA